jgi:hypothetical protein
MKFLTKIKDELIEIRFEFKTFKFSDRYRVEKINIH